MLNQLNCIFHRALSWGEYHLPKISKILILSILAVSSLLWSLIRLYLFTPHTQITSLGSAVTIALMLFCGWYFWRGSKYKDWSLEFTKYVIGHSLFLILLGAVWPSIVQVADFFIQLDSVSKSALLSFAGIVYVVSKMRFVIFRINDTRAAHVVHQFLSVPTKEEQVVERLAATHEAGHALLIACLKDIASIVTVSIKPDLSSTGRVSAMIQMQTLTATQLKWQMMLLLGGREAEYFRFKEYSVGGAADLMHWEYYAYQFLRNGMGEHFYNAPTTEIELKHNIQVIERLKRSQIAQLQQFIALNENVLATLESKLLQDKTISDSGLKEILKTVSVTDDMPQPINLF